ncbi:hypothetical protein KHA94_16325 [Bacillus sp. FJAT-49705]|uniref:Transposase n=1 Tax=Cytobacillus citreus TaxID=2833586 RepID=A0ABS5NVA4_9BACI|nr:hypothetical protein [Cytobacillus citreus]MBS4191757.1 hypothetical protein [Cytobacillus citreus]
MIIDYELLSTAIKKMAEGLKFLMDVIKEVWKSAKEFVASYKPDYPRQVHPASKLCFMKDYRIRSQVIINKPLRISARTAC